MGSTNTTPVVADQQVLRGTEGTQDKALHERTLTGCGRPGVRSRNRNFHGGSHQDGETFHLPRKNSQPFFILYPLKDSNSYPLRGGRSVGSLGNHSVFRTKGVRQ